MDALTWVGPAEEALTRPVQGTEEFQQKKIKPRRPKITEKRYTYHGAEFTLNQLAMLSGFDRLTLYKRIHNQKLSVEDACSQPKRAKPAVFEFKGKEYTLDELAELTGVNRKLIIQANC